MESSGRGRTVPDRASTASHSGTKWVANKCTRVDGDTCDTLRRRLTCDKAVVLSVHTRDGQAAKTDLVHLHADNLQRQPPPRQHLQGTTRSEQKAAHDATAVDDDVEAHATLLYTTPPCREPTR